MTMATLGVMQDVPNGAKRRAERERATADIGAAESGQAVETRNVRLAVALAWVDLYYAQRKLAALDEIEAALKPLHDTAPAQVAAGSSRPAAALEADELTAALGDRRAELLAAVGKARAELTRWTGEPSPEAIGAPPSQEVDAPSLRAALDRHPALLAYDVMGRQAAADLAAARADKRPDWSWEFAYHRRDPMWGDMVSLGGSVSLPIFPGKRQDPKIAAKAASAGRVSAEREAMRRQLRAQLDADLADHAMHHDRMMRARDTIVPLVRRKADLETASYAAANASLSEVLQAFLGLAETRVDALDREAAVVRDAVRINLTYGAGEP
jgi:outer membrane protein TolC